MTISESPLISAPEGTTPDKEATVSSDCPKSTQLEPKPVWRGESMLCPTHARNSSTSKCVQQTHGMPAHRFSGYCRSPTPDDVTGK